MPSRRRRWPVTAIVTVSILVGLPIGRRELFIWNATVAAQPQKAIDAPGALQAANGWPKIQIRDPVTRDATRRALDGAATWLGSSQCARLFSEFQDTRGQPLDERLRQLQSTPLDYLRLVYFQDGERHPTCRRDGILAFTEVGSRVVYVCGRDFARAWSREPRAIVATLIHEMLHSLGLGENPPTPGEISYRVQKLCWQ